MLLCNGFLGLVQDQDMRSTISRLFRILEILELATLVFEVPGIVPAFEPGLQVMQGNRGNRHEPGREAKRDGGGHSRCISRSMRESSIKPVCSG